MRKAGLFLKHVLLVGPALSDTFTCPACGALNNLPPSYLPSGIAPILATLLPDATGRTLEAIATLLASLVGSKHVRLPRLTAHPAHRPPRSPPIPLTAHPAHRPFRSPPTPLTAHSAHRPFRSPRPHIASYMHMHHLHLHLHLHLHTSPYCRANPAWPERSTR